MVRHPVVQSSTIAVFTFLFVASTLGVLTIPIRSIYLIEDLEGSAIQNGLMFSIPAIWAIFATPKLGVFSDRFADRRRLIFVYMLCLSGGSAALFLAPGSWSFVVAASLAFPFFGFTTSQLIVWAREKATRAHGENALQGSVFRVPYLVGWGVGPVLLGLLASAGVTYNDMFVLQAAGFLALATGIWIFGRYERDISTKRKEVFRWSQIGTLPRGLILIGLLVSFAMTGNLVRLANLAIFTNEYISDDPLVIAGVFAVSPIVELPALILGGWAAKRFGNKIVLLVGVVAGVIYFSLSGLVSTVPQLFVLQAVYALIPATILGVGINYAQNCTPENLGFATSVVFTGQLTAILLGGGLVAVGSAFLTAQTIFLLPLFFSILALLVWARLPRD